MTETGDGLIEKALTASKKKTKTENDGIDILNQIIR